MAAPKKGQHLTDQLRAFELYAMGGKKSEIARQIGVTRMTISNWVREGKWDERLTGVTAQANQAADHKVGDLVAAALIRLKTQLAKRVFELELLCGPSAKPATRIAAIKLWFQLAGVDRALPDPTNPTDPRSLELIEDLAKDS